MKVGRPNTVVRAPAAIVVAAPTVHDADVLTRALAEPVDIAELPFEVASYSTHSVDPDRLRVILLRPYE